MKVYDLKERSFQFGVEVIKLVRSLPKETASFVIADQLIRSATSVGANIIEGNAAYSKKDFTNFYTYSLKSAVESKFWLRVIVGSGLISQGKVSKLSGEAEELSKILGSIIIARLHLAIVSLARYN
jgi:four helix bundle protein